MKKRLFLLGLCILLLCGCSATAATTEEMVELARDKIPVSDAENIQMQAAGRVDTENNSALLIVRTGNEWQAHAYYPVTFEKRGGAYVRSHTLPKPCRRPGATAATAVSGETGMYC